MTEAVVTKYEKIIAEFAAARDWKDEITLDPDTNIVSLATGINFSSQTGRLIIEADNETDVVEVFIYFDLKCKEAKLREMKLLMNELHQRWKFGRFTTYDAGVVRWTHRVDFEGSSPTGKSIEQIVGPGWNAVETFADTVAAVALTKQTAEEAIGEYDAAQERDSDSEEAPSEL